MQFWFVPSQKLEIGQHVRIEGTYYAMSALAAELLVVSLAVEMAHAMIKATNPWRKYLMLDTPKIW